MFGIIKIIGLLIIAICFGIYSFLDDSTIGKGICTYGIICIVRYIMYIL